MKEGDTKEPPRSCSYFVAIALFGIAVFVILNIWQNFKELQAKDQLDDFVIGLSGCCGILVLGFVILFVIVPRLPKKPRQYKPGEEDERDDYYDYF